MLTDSEKRLVRRYYVMARLSRILPGTILLMCIETGIFVAVNDAFIHAGGMNIAGLATSIAIFLIAIAGLSVCFLVPRFGMNKPAWRAILKKGARGRHPTRRRPSQRRKRILHARQAG